MTQYALRLPDSLMQEARRLAEEEHTSLNQLFATAIAEKVSALRTERLLRERAARADADAYARVLAKVADRKPSRPDDQLDG